MSRNRITHAPSWRAWREVLALVAVILATFIPRSLGLDQFVTADEHLWLSRSANFYYALTHGDFAATYQKEHPGVTVMWAGTLAFLLRYPGYRGSGVGQLEPDQFHYYISRVKNLSSLELLATARLILVIGHTLVLALCYVFARQLIGLEPALLSFLFIAFDPFHLALSRILHLDALSSNFVLLALLSFIHYLRRNTLASLVISGIVAGLGWLTKSPALFVIPVVGLLALWNLWNRLSRPGTDFFAKRFWLATWPILTWTGMGIVIFLILWPAMWVRPIRTITRIFNRAQIHAEQGFVAPVLFSGRIYEDGGIGPERLDFYPLMYLWRTSPLTLLGVLLVIPAAILKSGLCRRSRTRLTLLGILLLIGIFYLGLTLSSNKADRYFLPAIAPADILSALGWTWLFSQIATAKIGGRIRRFLTPAGLAGVIALQAAMALNTYPYFFTYFDPLMGGSRKAVTAINIGWGEGIDQAARYLNQKPNAADLHVSSWFPAGSFNFFFEGHTRSIPFTQDMKKKEWENFLTSDYAVIYISQWQRQLSKSVLDYVSKLTPEFTVRLNGLEYVRVYKIR